jgi:Flp pilus assembly protein protease CpaA
MAALGALPFLAVAVFTDLKERKIRNWLTVPMFVLGLGAAWLTGGVPGLIASLKGAGVCLLVLMIVPFQRVGGGDLKLAAGCGAWLGWPQAGLFLYWAVVFTAGWAVIHALKRLGLKGIWYRFKQEISSLLFKAPLEPLAEVPGAVFLATGYIAALLFR